MEQVSFTVEQPERLDMFIASALQCSRSQANALIRKGSVYINDTACQKPSKYLHGNDRITVVQKTPITETRRTPMTDAADNILVLYRDASCLVINKPAGITVHPGSGTGEEETLIDRIRMQEGASLLLAHRLDKGTTGCLLLASSATALEYLQRQFQDRSIRKTYLAIVAGTPENTEAIIDAHIGRSLWNRTKMSLFRTANSRNAITRYATLSSDPTGSLSLLRCKIQTGRTHQIRVHLAGIGHPILGDTAYGNDVSGTLTTSMNVRRPMLHSWQLAFVSPDTETEITVTAPLPNDMRGILTAASLPIPDAPLS